MSELKIKICGLRDPDNIQDIAALSPDYLGFIFYPNSRRFVGEELDPELLRSLDAQISKVGVFVNAELQTVIEKAAYYHLDALQLHGDESADYCQKLTELLPDTELIKVFSVTPDFDFSVTAKYQPYCRLFLFDTACPSRGGSGRAFDWSILSSYRGQVPYLLSGGIGIDNLISALELIASQTLAVGIDLNSKVEAAPGLKSLELVKEIFRGAGR